MKKLIIITTLVLSLFSVIIGVYLYYPLLDSEKLFYSLFDAGFTVNSNQQVQPKSGDISYKELIAKSADSQSVILTKNNPFQPTITFIEENKAGSLYTTVLKLKRNYIKLEVDERIQINIKNKTFQEAVEIARKYDLTKENPDPANIIVYPAPTREEVETAKKRDTKDEELKNNPAFQPDLDKCISYIAKTVEEQKKQVQCLKDINTKYNTTYDIPKI